MFEGKGRRYITLSLVGHIVGFLVILGLSFPHIRIKRLSEIKPVKVYSVDLPRKTETKSPTSKPPRTRKERSRVRPTPVATPPPQKKVIKKPKPTPTKKPKPTPTPKRVAKATPKPKRAKPTPVPTPRIRRTPRRTPPPPRDIRPKTIRTPVTRSTPSTKPTPFLSQSRAETPQKGPLKLEANELPAFYLESVKMRIESNFSVPQHLKNTPAQCTIQFTIFRDGRIGNIQMIKSSGSSILDNLAVQALDKTGQLGPLPDTFPRESISVMLTFDYNF